MSLRGFLLFSLALTSATAGTIFDSYNGPPGPGAPNCCYWAPPTGNIGWYWTPSTDVMLEGIQTQLYAGNFNINNNFTMTVTLYTDRPAAGGTVLDSFTFNAATASLAWGGGTFAAPLSLTGGTSYFVGFSGWEQVLTASGGGGVNWVAIDPLPVGTRTLFPGYMGIDFATQMNPGPNPTTIDAPIMRFIAADPVSAVPEPSTFFLSSAALATVVWGRRRKR